MRSLLFIVCICFVSHSWAQDTTMSIENQTFTLADVIVRNNFEYKDILARIKRDTSFYKAFKTLRTIGYSSFNHIEMYDKNQKMEASLDSRTRQNRIGDCRTMDVIEEKTFGKLRENKLAYKEGVT